MTYQHIDPNDFDWWREQIRARSGGVQAMYHHTEQLSGLNLFEVGTIATEAAGHFNPYASSRLIALQKLCKDLPDEFRTIDQAGSEDEVEAIQEAQARILRGRTMKPVAASLAGLNSTSEIHSRLASEANNKDNPRRPDWLSRTWKPSFEVTDNGIVPVLYSFPDSITKAKLHETGDLSHSLQFRIAAQHYVLRNLFGDGAVDLDSRLVILGPDFKLRTLLVPYNHQLADTAQLSASVFMQTVRSGAIPEFSFKKETRQNIPLSALPVDARASIYRIISLNAVKSAIDAKKDLSTASLQQALLDMGVDINKYDKVDIGPMDIANQSRRSLSPDALTALIENCGSVNSDNIGLAYKVSVATVFSAKRSKKHEFAAQIEEIKAHAHQVLDDAASTVVEQFVNQSLPAEKPRSTVGVSPGM